MLLTRMLSGASCCASAFGEADLRGLDRVVGHAAARFAAPDRGDHDDRAAAARAHVRHGETRGADRGKQRLVEGRLPLGVGGLEQVAAAGAADVVDEDVEAAERFDRAFDDASMPAVVDTSA